MKIARNRRTAALLFALAWLPGCLGAPRREKPAAPGPRVTPVPVEEEARLSNQGAVVIWTPGPSEDLLAAADFLDNHPDIRVNAVLPSALLPNEEKSWKAWQIFSRLAAQRRLEMVLIVPGDPPLPLIQDTDFAKVSSRVSSLPPRFSRPEDVAGLLQLAWTSHRKYWRADPSCLLMPGGLLTGPETVHLARMKIRSVLLLEGSGAPGCFSGLPVGVVRPAAFPAGNPAAREQWFSRAAPPSPAMGTEEAPGLLPPVRLSTLADFSAFEETRARFAKGGYALLSEIDFSGGRWPAWPGIDREPVDFSPWIGKSEKNNAWQWLTFTRQAVEDYKNSGQAEVQNLDRALREIYNVESGGYFRRLGNDAADGQNTETKREFQAALAQVYRLMGKPVPAAFLQAGGKGPSSLATAREDRETEFSRAGDSLRWRDAEKDDRGPGDYFYPTGPEFMPGSWDLRRFTVQVQPENVSFQFDIGSLTNPWGGPEGFSFPLVDLYLDINRLPGAGSTVLLPRRPGLVEAQNAWEFALAVDGWGARFFQYAPGAAPRLVARPPVQVVPGSSGFRIDVPRRFFRGAADHWSYGVVVMGRDPSPVKLPPGDDAAAGTPMPVRGEPGPRQFGGAWAGTPHSSAGLEAPPFLDVLVPPGETQEQVLGAYKQGRDVVIPFVRPE